MDPRDRLVPAPERQYYETHNNDVNDPRYQAFVAPITTAVQRDFSPHSLSLDFGTGTGPVITKVLPDQGYALKLYDPFFGSPFIAIAIKGSTATTTSFAVR